MIKLVITDLDDTLYSWIKFFIPAFYEMVNELTLITGIDKDVLLVEYKEIHQSKGSVEFPFATFQLPSIKKLYPDYKPEELKVKLDSALHKFNSGRKKNLKLYPHVAETLKYLFDNNISIVGYTESAEENGYYRLKKLNIDMYFKEVYVSNSQYEKPNYIASSPKTIIVNSKKPNPDLLRDICGNEGVECTETLYVGDSLTKDIYMAKLAGVYSVWCNYKPDENAGDLYKKLVAISHWSNDDFKYESELKVKWSESNLSPDYTINNFQKIIDIIAELKNNA